LFYKKIGSQIIPVSSIEQNRREVAALAADVGMGVNAVSRKGFSPFSTSPGAGCTRNPEF
jgi:hypothetical protein